MKRYKDLYPELTTFHNLYHAFIKARRFKRDRKEILDFAYKLENELFSLKEELESFSYQSQTMKRAFLRRPEKKEIYIPAFRDRIVQQALIKILEPIFEIGFIHDSYAFRRDKGTHFAIKRFDQFKRKVASRKIPNAGYILKADIRDYYPTINHQILLGIVKKKIKDEKIIWLIGQILNNYPSKGQGIPVGSPISQLFANIYLNELDYFVKQQLQERYYLRYCDDFFILTKSMSRLVEVEAKIREFLRSIALELHPRKTDILGTNEGVDILGYKSFYFYRVPRRRNVRQFRRRLERLREVYKQGKIETPDLTNRIRGWIEYAKFGDSYNLRKRMLREFVISKARISTDLKLLNC
jgi:group II intron reverse transcriptase/maturase